MLFLFSHTRLSSLVQDEVYHSPSLRESPEKIYATPSEEEWYSESPPRKSLSPTTVKKMNKEMEAVTSPECNDWDPTGKTPCPRNPPCQPASAHQSQGTLAPSHWI
jgi:hypothetical protein